jgi:hypothetical protein
MNTGNMIADLIEQATILYLVFIALFVADKLKCESLKDQLEKNLKTQRMRLILMSGSVGSHFILNSIVVVRFLNGDEIGKPLLYISLFARILYLAIFLYMATKWL